MSSGFPQNYTHAHKNIQHLTEKKILMGETVEIRWSNIKNRVNLEIVYTLNDFKPTYLYY